MSVRRTALWCVLTLLLAACAAGPDAHDTAHDERSTAAPSSQDPTGSASDKPRLDVVTVAGVRLAADPRSPVGLELERLVEQWVRYAMGEADTFPHADSLTLALGGEPAGSVDTDALADRRTWTQCPEGRDTYSAASCPVDFLGVIRSSTVNDTVLVHGAELGEVTCAPARTGALPQVRVVVLRPEPQWRTCASDFAIALVVDDEDRVRHVDLMLSAP